MSSSAAASQAMPSPSQIVSGRLTRAGGRERYAAEGEALTARGDGRRQLVRFGGRQDEDDVRRRLLQRLEEGVEGRLRQHVHLVDEVDLVVAGAGREGDLLAQAADLVDAAVARRVQLDEVHGAAGEEVEAGLALITRLALS